MDLASELSSVEDELREAQAQMVSLGARIDGLIARRDALASAVRQVGSSPADEPGIKWSMLTKDRAIVEILRRSSEPMRIAEIVRELGLVGRTNENYNGVSVYLDTLLKQNRVERVARGLYVAAS